MPFLDLAAGRSDLMLSDKAPAAFWINTPEGQGFELKGKEIDVDDKMGIIVRNGDPLRLDFNKALSTVKANGVYDKIYQQYFGNTVAAAATASRVTVSASAAASVTQ